MDGKQLSSLVIVYVTITEFKYIIIVTFIQHYTFGTIRSFQHKVFQQVLLSYFLIHFADKH